MLARRGVRPYLAAGHICKPAGGWGTETVRMRRAAYELTIWITTGRPRSSSRHVMINCYIGLDQAPEA